MRDPLIDETGTPRQITRATVEVVAGQRVRWELWSGDVLNHSETIRVEQLGDALELIRSLISDSSSVGACHDAS